MDLSNLSKINYKKILLWLTIGLFLIILLNYITKNSRLELQNTTNEAIVVTIEGDNYQQKLDFEPNKKRTVRLKRGNYRVNASIDNKQSRYSVSTGYLLGKTTLGLELIEPKASIYLGKNSLRCAREINKKPVFYSCSPSKDGVILTDDAANLSRLTEGDAPDPNETPGSLVLKPYRDIFLEAREEDQNIFISKRGLAGYINKDDIKIEDFNFNINDGSFSLNESSNIYSVLDAEANRIVYGNLDAKEQKTIDLADKKIDYSQSRAMLESSGNKIYLLVSLNEEFLEGKTADETSGGPKTASSIFIFDSLTGKEIGTIKLRNNSLLSAISSGPGGLLYATNSEEGQGGGTTLITNNTKEIDLSGYGISSKKPCWIDEKTFYFQPVEGNSIYKYSVDKKVAYRVYQNNSPDDFIAEISCTDNNLYFSVDSKRDGELGVFNHYKLGDKAQAGKPIEEALPKYFEVDEDAYKATLSGAGKIKVGLIYDGGNNGPTDQNKIKSVLFEALSFEGVNISGLEFEYVN